MEPKIFTKQREFRLELEQTTAHRTALVEAVAQKLRADHGLVGIDNARKAAEAAIDIVTGRIASAEASLTETATVAPVVAAEEPAVEGEKRVLVRKG